MAEKQETRLVYTAENIGARLGHMAARLDAWKAQHQEITRELASLTKAAKAMVAGAVPSRRKRRMKLDEVRKQDKAATMKARTRAGWKDHEAAQGVAKEHSKPSDTRAVIRATEGKPWTARQRGRG